MRRFRILLPIFLGTLAYCALSVFVGPRGLLPMSQLERERESLVRNIDALYATNAKLDAEFKNLQANPDTIGVYAHELGYVSKNERLIKLAGYSCGVNRDFTTGEAIALSSPSYLAEWLCKFLGVAVGVAAFCMLRFLRLKSSGGKKEQRSFD